MSLSAEPIRELKQSDAPPGPLWLLRARWRAITHAARLREHSRLEVIFVGAFAVLLPLGLFWTFLSGFRFLTTLGGVGLMLVRPMFSLFFLGIGAMMTLSAFVTAFSTIFRSEETEWLRASPAAPPVIALYKWLETSFLSAWAYFFIVLPFAAAYGRHEGYMVLFSMAMLAYSVPFVMLCSGLGLLSCIFVARWAPRGRALRVLPMVGIGLALAVLWRARPTPGEWGGEIGLFLQRIAPGLRISAHPLWPSAWLAEGVLAAARGAWGRSAFYWALLVANTAMLALAIEAAGQKKLPEAWLRVADATGVRVSRQKSVRRRRRSVWAWPLFASDWIALALKDIRIFLRDPVQWSQGLFFFALLALYFLNLRTFRYDELDATWRDLIAFLNVFSVAAVACSFASRFLYPQLSLEGHAIWILGLSPGGLLRAYAVKLAVSIFGLSAISAGLTALSVRMLGAGAVTSQTAVAVACLLGGSAACLSVGLGAVFLDTRERNPAAIVSGFGGTLNLILNLGLMLAVTVTFGALFHLRHRLAMADGLFLRYRAFALAALAFVCGAASTASVWFGAVSLRRREF